jgi:glutathione S-transferase
MKLYGDVISPFVRMALVTAHEVGLAGKIERIETRVQPFEENPILAQVSPLGKVPVFVTDHGHALYDSRVIIEYLCHISGNKTLIPDDGVKRFRILTLQALAQGVCEAAVSYRYEIAARPQGSQWEAWMNRQRKRVDAALNDIERTIDLGEVNAGTIAVAAALGYLDFRLGDWNWRNGRPKLTGFYESFSKRESMAKTALPAA